MDTKPSPPAQVAGSKVGLAAKYSNCRVIMNLPAYVSLAQIRQYTDTLAELKAVYRSAYFNNNTAYDLYLDLEPDATNSANMTADNCVFIGDRRYILSQFDSYRETLKPIVETLNDALSIGERLHMEKPAYDMPTASSENLTNIVSCMYCYGDTDNTAVTPCLNCSQVICNTCLKKAFQTALLDHECMPVQHCGRVIHPVVAKNVLTDEEIERYKLRFEELLTKRPFYCAEPRCSAFIPPRKLRIVQGVVTCAQCKSKTCGDCRELAKPEHQCFEVQKAEDKMLSRYQYKRCPNCCRGQALMFGCSHMRCACGTHWCWNCGQLMKGCDCPDIDHSPDYDSEYYPDTDEDYPDSDEDEDEDEDEDMDDVWSLSETDEVTIPIDPRLLANEAGTSAADVDEDSSLHLGRDDGNSVEFGTPAIVTNESHASSPDETVDSSSTWDEDGTRPGPILNEESSNIALAETMDSNTMNDNNQGNTAQMEQVDVNLDGDHINWQYEPIELNGEPEEMMTPWSCRHGFQKLYKHSFPQHWMSASEENWWDKDEKGLWRRTIECMCCQHDVFIEDIRMSGEEAEVDSAAPGGSGEPMTKEKQQDERKDGFRCLSCGVILCGRCKKAMQR